MGPLFLICCNQKRVQYYCFFGKNPNDFTLNHQRFPVNIALVYIHSMETALHEVAVAAYFMLINLRFYPVAVIFDQLN